MWITLLIQPVFLCLLYVRAEREGDFLLHLHCVQEMMPIIFAAGHHFYAHWGSYYIESMKHLPPEILEKFLKGMHVPRQKKGYGMESGVIC